MSRKIAFWLACFIVRSSTPGLSFTYPLHPPTRWSPTQGLTRRGRWERHGVGQGTTPTDSLYDHEKVTENLSMAKDAGDVTGPPRLRSQRTCTDVSSRVDFVGVTQPWVHLLNCASAWVLAIAILVYPISATNADTLDGDFTGRQTTELEYSTSRKVRRSPPEIPPGRITIVQWLSRIKLRYLPDSVDIKKTVRPAVVDLARIAQQATTELGQSSPRVKMANPGAYGADQDPDDSSPSDKPAAAAAPLLADVGSVSHVEQKSPIQEEIDALKAELLNPDAEPPKPDRARLNPAASRQANIETMSRFVPKFPRYDISSLTRPLPIPSRGTPEPRGSAVDGEDKTSAGRAAARSRARGRVAVDDVVDLKVELRAEAAKSGPARSLSGTEVQTIAVDKESSSSMTDLASRTPSEESGSAPDSGILVGPGGQLSSAEVARRKDMVTEMQDTLDALDPERISDQAMDVAAQYAPLIRGNGDSCSLLFAELAALARQVQGLANKQRREMGAGFSAAVEQVQGLASKRQSEIGAGFSAAVEQAQDLASKQQSDVRAGISAAVEQVQDLASKQQSGIKAGISASVEQVQGLASERQDKIGGEFSAVVGKGRASVSRLQAETDQVATGLRRAAAPLAGNPFSKISEISERASSSWSSGVGKVKGASERLSGVLVGLGKLAPYVRQGGQALGNGLALLGREASKRVAGPMADVSSKIVDASGKTGREALAALDSGAAGIRDRLSSSLPGGSSALSSLSREALQQRLHELGEGFNGRATRLMESMSAGTSRLLEGTGLEEQPSRELIYGGVAAGIALAGGALLMRGTGAGSEGTGTGVRGRTPDEEAERTLQPIGIAGDKTQAVKHSEGSDFGVRAATGAVSASGTLWEMIRQSGTGTGDAVRDVSEQDLLTRAVDVGGQLRETSEGLDSLKADVIALRESIRENDLEGQAKALKERLNSAPGEGV